MLVIDKFTHFSDPVGIKSIDEESRYRLSISFRRHISAKAVVGSVEDCIISVLSEVENIPVYTHKISVAYTVWTALDKEDRFDVIGGFNILFRDLLDGKDQVQRNFLFCRFFLWELVPVLFEVSFSQTFKSGDTKQLLRNAL